MMITSLDFLHFYEDGGEKPDLNPTFEVVLDALAPVAKDGILSADDGESDPAAAIPVEDSTAEELMLDMVANTISLGEVAPAESNPAPPSEEAHHRHPGIVQESEEVTTKTTKVDSILEIEKQKLALEQERLQVAKEQLEVSRQISGSLGEISHNFQLFLSNLLLRDQTN
ncbi:uncharacterized protein LOC119734113 [Patiria miniata]|uniref:Uncharacterized protein n=1 Tax=Patiria miniata TaxID=46514 RepID=A0A914AJ23_PATMI|nr:uncharacterized protein LOC119734113 [Patiria miniata]